MLAEAALAHTTGPEIVDYGKGDSWVGSDRLPMGQPVRPLRGWMGVEDSLEWFGSDAGDVAALINWTTAVSDDHST